jgi:metal-responsive CopG/Arc/MetJ family transcriptional regulator
MTKEEWQGAEDSPKMQWVEMKARHEKELAELQAEYAKAVVLLISTHMHERDSITRNR